MHDYMNRLSQADMPHKDRESDDEHDHGYFETDIIAITTWGSHVSIAFYKGASGPT